MISTFGRARAGLMALFAALGAVIAVAAVHVAPAHAASGADREAESLAGRWIAVYESAVAAPGAKTAKLERAAGFRSRFEYRNAVKGFAARLSPGQLAKVKADPAVAFVVPDRPVHASSEPLAAGEPVPPTGVRRIEAATSSAVHGSSGANVAVLDTGLDLAHPDLNAVSGTNCVTPGAPAQDDNGHGTHAAGSIGARNNGAGVTGVAPGTRLISVKVLDAAGSGSWSEIICGIDWVTSTRTDADPGNDIAVASMSLGGPGTPVAGCATTTDPLHRAICRSTAAGVTYVVAAGNDGWDFDYAQVPDVPAAYPEVLTVTAVTDSDGRPGAGGGAPTCRSGEADDRYASYSNFAATASGAAHTIAAPGTCIASTWTGGGYATISGTSMATPHVAGAVALCLSEGGSAGPCAGRSPAEVISHVRASAQAHTTTAPGYGFTGDPVRPVSGAYFGYLARVGITVPVTTAPSDTTAPSVTAIAPADRSAWVASGSSVSVAFSEPMNSASAQGAFSLVYASTGAPVSGSFTWSGNTMTFRPAAPLPQGTWFTARIEGAGSASPATDVAGNPLAPTRTWSFGTATRVTAAPGGTAIQTGTLRAGGYSSLRYDDGQFFAVNSAGNTASWYGRFYGVSRALRNLRVMYRGKASRTVTQTVAIWRWTTSSWIQLDSRSVGTTEALVDRLPGGTLADYVSGTGSTGEVRVRIRSTGGGSFFTSGDLLSIAYDAPAP